MIENIKTKKCPFCGTEMEECDQISNQPIVHSINGNYNHSFHAAEGLRCPTCGYLALFALKEDGNK